MRAPAQTQEAPSLPSLETFKSALGGYISSSGVLRFPRPGGDPKDRSCTVTLDPHAPDGFVVADARGIIGGLELKDYVRKLVGLQPFSRAAQRRSNGVAKSHRPAGGPIAHDHQQREKRLRVRFIPFGAIRVSERRRYLVQGFLPRTGLAVIWGEAKCGKSFWTFDLAMHVALGREYRGRKVEKGAVIYCAFEGQAGFEGRVEAYRRRHLAEDHDPDEIQFQLMPVTLNLVREHNELIQAILEQFPDERPVAVFLDTLNRSFQGSESSDEDMTAYVSAADAIKEAFQCMVGIVHHCGLDKSRPRGHTSLLGAYDAMISVKRDKRSGLITSTVDDMKDGQAGACVVSRLDVVDVGRDVDNAEITSCVIVPVESRAPLQADKAKERKLTVGAKIALDALKDALADEGTTPALSNNIPPNTPTVGLSTWRRKLYERNPAGDEKEKEARKKAFQRDRERLQECGFAGVWGPENATDEQVHCWLST